MRIISKFRDYYDGVGSYGGFDNSLTYVRHTEEFHIDYHAERKGQVTMYSRIADAVRFRNSLPRSLKKSWWIDFEPDNYIGSVAVFFCGKGYGLIKFDGRYFSDFDSFEEYLTVKSDAFVKTYCNQVNKYRQAILYLKRQEELQSKNKKTAFFTKSAWDSVENGSLIGDESFRSLNTPIFLIKKTMERRDYVVVNPNLSGYGFPAFVDPFTAYQEVDMYLGNNLVEIEDPSVNRTDELIRDSKGFDDKSFKETSPGKKARRKENRLRKKQKKNMET